MNKKSEDKVVRAVDNLLVEDIIELFRQGKIVEAKSLAKTHMTDVDADILINDLHKIMAENIIPVTDICPFCGLYGKDTVQSLVEEARGCTVLFICDNLHIFGRGT